MELRIGGLYAVCSALGIGWADREKILIPEKTDSKLRIAADTVVTFLCAAFAWVFFRAQSLGSAVTYVGRMLSFKAGEASLAAQARDLGFTKVDCVIPVFVIINNLRENPFR